MSARVDAQRAAPGRFSADATGARWTFSGVLTFANASRVFAEATELPLPTSGEIDLSSLAAVDSSAVAVLLALSRRAQEENKPLAFTKVPAALRALADLYSVEDLLAA